MSWIKLKRNTRTDLAVAKHSRHAVGLSVLFCALTLAAASGVEARQNELAGHPSPYLALHGQDPVAWQSWGRAALDAAKREDKLVFVSVGYFACHWCHVMQRESYRNRDIAALLNKHFIAVKVDRETHGALDSYLQNFAEETRKQAGWPLNVFITPEGYPLVALLYEPPGDFQTALTRLIERWQKERAQLKALAEKHPSRAKAKVGAAEFAPAVAVNLRRQFVREALAKADMLGGGFGNTQKFPSSPQLATLLEAYVAEPNAELAEFLTTTLDRMADLGLYDHLGGGFFRYTTDPDWRTPHFEKMLYDNAMLARVYLRAADVLKRPRYREIGLRSVDFMLRDLKDASGALYTSTSAIDGKGDEGGVYLWSKAELDKTLSADERRAVARVWQIDKERAFTPRFLPLQAATPSAAEQPLLASAYAKLVRVRATRNLPKDRKMLTGLNGLALAALSDATRVAPSYRGAADQIYAFLKSQWQPATGLAKGPRLGAGELDDYAYAAHGALSYAELSKSPDAQEFARTLTREAWRRFFTEYGWKSEQQPLLPRQAEQLLIADAPTPSPAALLIETSWKLGDKAFRRDALAAANSGQDLLNQSAFWDATHVRAMMGLR